MDRYMLVIIVGVILAISLTSYELFLGNYGGAWSNGCQTDTCYIRPNPESIIDPTIGKIVNNTNETPKDAVSIYSPPTQITFEDLEPYIYSTLDDAVKWFNSRYNTKIRKISVSLIAPGYNETMSYYDPETEIIHIAKATIWVKINNNSLVYSNPTYINYTMWHEFCHFVMDEYCDAIYKDWQESFCEVFSGVNNTNCNGRTDIYCLPFKTYEVDRLGFLDCVFEKKCGNKGYQYNHINQCYEKWKL